jgi:hypothetical protein
MALICTSSSESYQMLVDRAEGILNGVNPITPAQIKDLYMETLWRF